MTFSNCLVFTEGIVGENIVPLVCPKARDVLEMHVVFYYMHKINIIYDGVEAETRKSQASIQII